MLLKSYVKSSKTYFLVDSSDIGKTPLVEMEIDTGDSLPITQKPYTLPLKHAEWVQKELEILEKAGVIVRSVSPWASPIVVVSKRTAPGEPPKWRLCVDYRAINSLLPPMKKAFSKAKGVLTLVPLPKIDEIYAHLKDSMIYSSFDLCKVDITIWSYQKNLGQSWCLFLPMVNGNLKDVHLDWHRRLLIFRD